MLTKKLLESTIAARGRTGRNLGTAVEAGKFTVVEVEYDDDGKSTVTDLTRAGSCQQAITYLEALG